MSEVLSLARFDIHFFLFVFSRLDERENEEEKEEEEGGDDEEGKSNKFTPHDSKHIQQQGEFLLSS